MRRPTLAALLLLTAAGLLAQADAKKPPAPPFPPDVLDAAYGSHERHRLDLWRAKSERPTPLVVFIHGGGWHGGDKSAVPAELLTFMLAHGVSVASINYRYTSMATVPGPLHDGARAVQFLRSKAAEWKLDPKRIGAMGVSAGGCTTLWLAYHDDLADAKSADPVARESSRLQAAVGMSPQTSLDSEEVIGWVGDQVMNHPMITRAVGAKNRAQVRERYAEYSPAMREGSPITHVSRDDPPVMLAYPTMAALPAVDAGHAIHHAMQGVKLKERADAAGLVCLLRIEDQPSPSSPRPDEFLLKHLTAKTGR
ncbi:MAG: alpha/beta hydrolase [Opitutus sp.]|nr:alpha/beta hydrolase [Opitutus sp.]